MEMEVQFGEQGLVWHADAFGLSSVGRRAPSEVFKQGRDLHRFALREVMMAATQRKF